MTRRARIPLQNPSLTDLYGELRADYAAAKSSRFRRTRSGVPAMGASADYHYRTEGDYLRLLEYARDMDRNDAVIGSAIDRAVHNTIQQGFTLRPLTGDEKADEALRTRWEDWAGDPDQCDLAGEKTWWEIEHLAFRHCLVDGDIIGLGNRDGALELVEGHRLRTPLAKSGEPYKRLPAALADVIHGVQVDSKTRRRLKYYFTAQDVSTQQTVRDREVKPYDVRDADGNRQIFHALVSKRVSQTRGITALAPVFDVAAMFEDIQFAKLVQQMMVSCFVVFHERELEFSGEAGTPQKGEQTEDTLADGVQRVLEGMSPGLEIEGAPGVKVKMDSPRVPNPEYFPHVKLLLQLVGINLGLPLVLVLMDASQTNFSGWRGALEEAKKSFAANQRRLRLRWHSPIYRWKVRQFLAEDSTIARLAEAGKIDPFAHHWGTPTWPYIEPLKEAQAQILEVRGGLSSPRRVQATRGREWPDVVRETVEDNTLAIRAAKAAAAEINDAFPDDDPVHWRELIALPLPEGLKVSLTASAEPAEERGETEETRRGEG